VDRGGPQRTAAIAREVPMTSDPVERFEQFFRTGWRDSRRRGAVQLNLACHSPYQGGQPVEQARWYWSPGKKKLCAE